MSFLYVHQKESVVRIWSVNRLFAGICAACLWPAQIPGRRCLHIRNQSCALLCPVPSWCHGHEAVRRWAESDGYLYRNISFSPPASVHIKSLAHHTSLLSRSRLSPASPHIWRHFLATVLQCCCALQIQWNRLMHLIDVAEGFNPGQEGSLLKGSWIEKDEQFNTAFNLFHKLQPRGLKGQQ